MRRLILSSTFDFLAFLLGLLSFAAGLGPLLTVVLLRSDDCIAVESDCAGPSSLMRTFFTASRWPRQPRLFIMSRRSLSSPSPSPLPDIKRPRLDGLTPDDYRNGVMLAPMVRSGARKWLKTFPSLRKQHNYMRSSDATLCSQAWCEACVGSGNGRQSYVER